MNKEELLGRTKKFAHRCVKLAMCLPENDIGKHVRKQLVRCSTSVAANYRATCQARSRAAFIAKLSIVTEEADESEFWLEFAIDEKLIINEEIVELKNESHELASFFIKSRMTAQNRN